MNAIQQKEALTQELEGLVADVKAGDEKAIARAEAIVDEISELDTIISKASEKAATIEALGQTSESTPRKGADMSQKQQYRDVAEATVAAVKDAGLRRGEPGRVAAEFKAATDTVVSPNPGDLEISDRVVAGPSGISAVRALFPVEQVSSPTIGFYRLSTEGTAGAVAEGGAKPQISAVGELITVGLKKIAAFLRMTDELIEDYPRLVSAIRGRLLHAKEIAIENQLINGSGAGANITGLLNQGIGTATYTAGSAEDVADAIFEAAMTIKDASGYDADAIIINPVDMATLRLAKDANDQYYGGGFFQGAYGNGAELGMYPAIWGMRVAVSTAIAQGTIIVGAFRTCSAIAQKGGVRVELGYDTDDFSHDRVSLRGEERLALEVFDPSGFVALTAE